MPPMNLHFSACSVHSWIIFPITICPWTQGDKEEIGREEILAALKLVPLALTLHIWQ